MILNHVADGAGLIVECAAALDAEVFRHGDLHALDMVAVPERLEERIREAEVDHVLHGPLPEVMVDAEDRRFGKGSEQNPVQCPGRPEVCPKGLFDDHAGAFRAARLAELLDDRTEEHRRYGEVVRRTLRGAEFFADGRKRGEVLVVAVDVAQQAAELFEGRAVETAVLFEAVLRTRPQLVEGPGGLGHADDRHVEMAAFDHGLQRGEDFLVSQVARCAEEDEGIGLGRIHDRLSYAAPLPAGFSRCPPN